MRTRQLLQQLYAILLVRNKTFILLHTISTKRNDEWLDSATLVSVSGTSLYNLVEAFLLVQEEQGQLLDDLRSRTPFRYIKIICK